MKKAVLSAVSLILLASCATWNSSPALAKEYYNLGKVYFDLKKYEDSARAYKIAISLDPSLKVAQLNLVRALAEQNDLDGAWSFLQPLLDKDPDNLVLVKVEAYLLWLKGKKNESTALWKDLATKLPADADTQFNFAFVAAEQGWKDEEWKALIKYADLGGQEPRAWKMLGTEAVARKDWDRAVQAYSQVVKLDPKDAEALASLSQIYVNLERFDDASEVLKKAIALEDQNAQAALSTETKSPDSTPVSAVPPSPTRPQTAKAADSGPPSSQVTAQGAHKGEWSYRLGTILLYGIEDYRDAFDAFRTAWKAGWTDVKVWNALLAVPDLPQKIRLEADLRSIGVFGGKS